MKGRGGRRGATVYDNAAMSRGTHGKFHGERGGGGRGGLGEGGRQNATIDTILDEACLSSRRQAPALEFSKRLRRVDVYLLLQAIP